MMRTQEAAGLLGGSGADHVAFERIAAAPQPALEAIVDRLRLDAAQVQLFRAPRAVRLMMRLREGITRAPFNLGEVLVSEAEVGLEGGRAYMMVLGEALDRALLAAVVLAAHRARAEWRSVIDAALAPLAEAAALERRRRWAAVQRSRVEFEGGPIEAYSAADRTKGRGS